MNRDDREQGQRIDFMVNDEHYTTRERELTPIEIMGIAGVDPQTNYLVEIRGNKQISYQETANEKIRMHERMKFITIFIGPTPVA